MKKLLLLCMIASLTACVNQMPYKRPMQTAYKENIDDVQIYTLATKDGIGVRYMLQDSSAATAQYGLLGALVGSVMDNIMNAGPKEQSAKLANKLATQFDVEATEKELQATIGNELRNNTGMHFRQEPKHVKAETRLEPAAFEENNVLFIGLDYVMSPDLSQLHLIANSILISKNVKYQGVYPKEAEELNKLDSERASALTSRRPARNLAVDPRGQIYRNRINYISEPVVITPLTAEELEAKKNEIKGKYLEKNGQLTSDKKRLAKYNSEIAEINSPRSPEAIASGRANAWIANDGAQLKLAVSNGIKEIGRALALDLNDPSIPNFEAKGGDTAINEDDSRKVLKRIKGFDAGSLVSQPKKSTVNQVWNAVSRGDASAAVTE